MMTNRRKDDGGHYPKGCQGHMGKDFKHAKDIDHTMKVDSCILKNDRLVNTKEIQIFAQTKIIG